MAARKTVGRELEERMLETRARAAKGELRQRVQDHSSGNDGAKAKQPVPVAFPCQVRGAHQGVHADRDYAVGVTGREHESSHRRARMAVKPIRDIDVDEGKRIPADDIFRDSAEEPGCRDECDRGARQPRSCVTRGSRH